MYHVVERPGAQCLKPVIKPVKLAFRSHQNIWKWAAWSNSCFRPWLLEKRVTGRGLLEPLRVWTWRDGSAADPSPVHSMQEHSFVHLEPLAIKTHCHHCKLSHGCQSEEVLFLIFTDCILSIKLAFQNSLGTVYILWPFCLISFV